MEREYGLVANVKDDRVFRRGAKVTLSLPTGMADRAKFFGLNKQGRVVSKYIPFKRLYNFRPKWIPQHSRGGLYGAWLLTKQAAQNWATNCEKDNNPTA